MANSSDKKPSAESLADHAQHGWTNGIVRTFLHSNLPIILLILSIAIGLTAVRRAGWPHP